MTVKEILLSEPKKLGETSYDYFRRLSKKYGYTFKSFKTKYYQKYKKSGLQISKIVKHPSGNETEVYTRESQEVDTAKMIVERVTTNPHGGQWVKYKNDGTLSEDVIDEILARIIKRHPIDVTVVDKPKISQKSSLQVVITDDHIGLDTNPEGIALFPYAYREKDYRRALSNVFRSIKKEVDQYGTFEEVVINNLGDFVLCH